MNDFEQALAEAQFCHDNQARFTAAFAAVQEAASDADQIHALTELNSLLQESKEAAK